MRLRLISSAGLLAAASAVAVSAFAAVSPVQLFSSALAAAHAQRSVHYVMTQTSPGRTVTIVGDAAIDRGTQRITYRKGVHAGHVTVVVAANTAYVRGDAFTLTNYMGFPAAAAAAYAGRWLSLAHTAPDFKTVAAAVRLGSAIDQLKMPQPFTSTGAANVQGIPVAGIESQFSRGGQRITETLYVRATGSPLPVEQNARGATIQMKITLSDWNEPVEVSAPTHAVPIR
jgi:hypothetical protein